MTPLLAAAERFRNPSHYRCTDNSIDCADAWMLAKAWLAEHPQDDIEPLTLEWLLSVGFTLDHNGCPMIDGLRVRPEQKGSKEGYTYFAYAYIESLPIRIPENRGQLRRLCACFNIKLKT